MPPKPPVRASSPDPIGHHHLKRRHAHPDSSKEGPASGTNVKSMDRLEHAIQEEHQRLIAESAAADATADSLRRRTRCSAVDTIDNPSHPQHKSKVSLQSGGKCGEERKSSELALALGRQVSISPLLRFSVALALRARLNRRALCHTLAAAGKAANAQGARRCPLHSKAKSAVSFAFR